MISVYVARFLRQWLGSRSSNLRVGGLVNIGRSLTAINLGGEGEVPKVINQQRPATLSPQWGSARQGFTLEELAIQGNDFLISPNAALPIGDGSIDLVLTNSVPIDSVMFGEPTVQTSEIHRILATNGRWVHDGTLRYTKP